ncbi:hypothetical protein WV31_02445 [Magnetospirillum sp. ME-1]|uniref:hypothetical protein n=1 Tax=Magnetospirillum sp. ME-1 TaxID=1639348 RepID=UPI000A17EAA4|nr:hypothetical protein [Magnetospirillum sp. ME-1]ARJ64613.1 hypothetical protein WV31_02445 [Magnetospirillum sp. ME-1]
MTQSCIPAARPAASPDDWFLAVVLTVSQFTFLLALRPLAGIGIWFQSEPVSAANAALAALVAAILAVRTSRRLRIGAIALLLVCLAGWSVLTLPFALAPASSWLGTPQSGHGIGWLLTTAAFAAGAANLRRRHGPLALVAAGAVSAAIMIVALNRWAPMDWRPQHFKEIGAYNALFAWAVLMSSRPRLGSSIAATLGLLALLALCGNRTSVIAVLAGGGAMGLAAWLGHRPQGRRVAALLPVLAALGVTAGIVGFGSYQALRDFHKSVRDTVVSRANMTRVVGAEIAQSPGILATGLGWGSFDVALARSMTLDGVALQPDASEEFLFWDAAHRNDFHTHNEVIEAALAGGLPAALGWLGLLGLAAHQAPRRRRPAAAGFAVALAVLASMWFQLPTSVPAFGIALGLVTTPRRRGRAAWRLRAGVSALAALLAVTSVAQWLRAMEGRREFADPRPACAPIMGGYARIHAVWLVQMQWHRLEDALQDPSALPLEAQRLKAALCSIDAMAQARDGAPFAVEATIIRSDLLAAAWPAEAGELRKELVSGLGDGLARTLSMAPRRSDLAPPYLGALLAQGQEQDLMAFIRRHLSPDDPVALWYSGSVMIGRPETFEAGLRRLRAALAAGIERFVMIPAPLKTQIKAAGGPMN